MSAPRQPAPAPGRRAPSQVRFPSQESVDALLSGGGDAAVEVIIIGGGCYGTSYARRLTQARLRGKVPPLHLRVVDRDPGCLTARELSPGSTAGGVTLELVQADWYAFGPAYLAGLEPDTRSLLVPAPLAPHILRDWLAAELVARGAEVTVEPLPPGAGTPFERQGSDGALYLSHADWTCPVNCIEPSSCPAILAPRTWEMAETLARRAAELGLDACEVLWCRHWRQGVGVVPVRDLLGARDRALAARGRTHRVLVASASSCHAAAGVLAVRAGAAPAPPPASTPRR